jgi:hypothetical protein
MGTAAICPDRWEIADTMGLPRTEVAGTRTTEWAALVAIPEASGTGAELFLAATDVDRWMAIGFVFSALPESRFFEVLSVSRIDLGVGTFAFCC